MVLIFHDYGGELSNSLKSSSKSPFWKQNDFRDLQQIVVKSLKSVLPHKDYWLQCFAKDDSGIDWVKEDFDTLYIFVNGFMIA